MVFDAYREVKPFVYDHRVIRSDGSVRMLHTRGEVVADAHGKAVRMIGACWDITDRWQATQQREKSLSLLEATLESTADGLLVVDRNGKVVAYNQRLLDLWRLTREAAAGYDFEGLLALVHDQLENGEACLRRVRELTSQPEAESFDTLQFRDGRFFERYSRPQRVGNEVVGRVWSYRDVTKRERLLSNAIFLADASRLLASLDIERALEAVAHLALGQLGDTCAVDLYSQGEPRRLLLLSRDPKAPLIEELPRPARPTNPTIYAVGPTPHITIPLTARGELLGALTFAASPDRGYTSGDLSLATELGLRIELALENARLYRNAQQALTVRDEFLSIAAHEIRGPLTAIHLAVQGLISLPPPSAAAKLLATIEREDRRIGRFVDEMLDIARIRAGQMRFVFEPVDLVEVTRDVANRFSSALSQSGSALSITVPGSVVGVWDRERLDQILTNLLSNAIKFGLGKPISVTIERDIGSARLRVQDHGTGIPVEAQKRIFEPFERAVSPRHYGGLGMGLYIVRSIVDGLAGSVAVESEPGVGSTFTVTLPLTRSK